MIPLPYALLDRICDIASGLDDGTAEALAELFRACPDARQSHRARDQLRMVCDAQIRGRVEILFDTWRLVAPSTTGAEIAAALYAATVQTNRIIRSASG